MDGNPHFEDYQLDLDNAGEYDATMMQLHATLALAYEQRTANLIAIVGANLVPNKLLEVLAQDISNRLGLSA